MARGGRGGRGGRGDRGGGQGGRGGRGGCGGGNFNNDGNLYCNNCGNNRSHTTRDCRKGGGPQNQNNRVDKNSRNNRRERNNNSNNGRDRSQNGNGNGRRNNNNDPCTRCGLYGHNLRNCNAQEVPEGEQCGCGCAFHREHQCPWNNDPMVRDEAESQATGMICQWCKDTGDGMHAYDDCKGPRDFRNNLLRKINAAYDAILWCWHCSSTNHATRACKATSSDQRKSRWDVVITSIIERWVHHTYSQFDAAYRDEGNDVAMVTAISSNRPPEPADFTWCIICEEFGHHVNNGTKGCDQAEYERRCPPQFPGQALAARQPFVPPNFARATGAYNSSHGHFTSTSFPCVNRECYNQNVGPFSIRPPAMGESLICAQCRTSNPHPAFNKRRDSKMELLKMVAEILDKGRSSDSEGHKSKKSILDAIKNPYHKRPSLALSKRLAMYRWPEQQPQYTDLSAQLNQPQVFRDNGSYFNELGNHQTYFPAAKFHVTEEMVEVANNDDLFINRAGRLGLRLGCLTCGMPAIVLDDEGDMVMCGTDGTCTVGCGEGLPFWADEYGIIRQSCRCLPVIGQVSNVAWLR